MSSTDCTCPICLEILIEPVSFSCTHEICFSCLDGLMKTNEHSTCPICREEITLDALAYKLKIGERCPKCESSPFHVYCPLTKKVLAKRYLVNAARWRKIKIRFNDEIQDRLSGKTAINLAKTMTASKENSTLNVRTGNWDISWRKFVNY